MKSLLRYASDEQERKQLKKVVRKKGKRNNYIGEGKKLSAVTFEPTGGKDPLVLNKRKGKVY